MNNLFGLLSTAGATTNGGGMQSILIIVLYIAIFGVGIYFLMIRPQKKQEAKLRLF